MKNIFDSIQIFAPKKNSFDLSHEKKLSMNMGDLIPIYQQEILPGDTFKVSSEQLIRLAPLVAPMMHRVKCTTHYFFVPNRLLWNEWEPFITGGEDGLQAPPFPQLKVNNLTPADRYKKGTLGDYLGIPITPDDTSTISSELAISALPFRAYQHIYNEYYRDQNLEPKIEFGIGGGAIGSPDAEPLTTLRKRAWEKDYFTSALPFAQKGGEVQLPIESSFTPQYKETGIIIDSTTGLPMDSATALATDKLNSGAGGAAGNMIYSDAAGTNPTDVHIKNLQDDQTVDATTVTITELRKAARLQEWLEKNARAGSRYVEQLLHMFGVKSDDARLQRPEYLGGGSQPVVISEVLQTSANGSDVQQFDTPQGNMAGHGISVGKSNTFNKSFKEHGIILGIMSVIPRTTYENGINRSWLKFDKFDYYWPDFAHIGEQELINKELFHNWVATAQENEETFGYQSRYAEYKYQQSTVHGDFRTGSAGEVNLSYWHMGRVFNTQPQLNASFIQSDPTHRVFAVDDPTEHKLYVQIYNRVKALRPIPYFSNPKL